MNIDEEIKKLEGQSKNWENIIYNEIQYKIYIKNLITNNIEKIDKNLNNINVIKKEIEKDFLNKNITVDEINQFNEIIKIKNNLEFVLQGINNFINISDEIKILEKMLYNKDMNYLEIYSKIEELNSVKNILLSHNIDSQVKEKIKNLQKLNDIFIDKCLLYLENNFIIENKSFKLMNNIFYILSKICDKEKITNSINVSINNKFESKLKNKEDLGDILENFNFSVDDLLDIHNLKLPIINKYFKEWEIFIDIEKNYKFNIDKYISPIFKNLDKIKESPGILIHWINWINSYEILWKKVGVLTLDCKELKQNLELNLPIFKIHLINLFEKVINNTINNDKFYNDKYIADYFQENEEINLESSFPYDLCFFYNEQIEILSSNIPENLLIDINIEWVNIIDKILQSNLELVKLKKDSDLNIILNSILNVNNNYILYININKIKKKMNEILNQYELVENMNKSFNMLFLNINKYQNDFIQTIINLLSKPLKENYINNFFRFDWFNENTFLFDSLEFIKNNILMMNKYFKNKIINYKFEKYVFYKFIDYYNYTFIWIMQNIFYKDKILINFEANKYLEVDKKEKDRKKLKELYKNKDNFFNLLKQEIKIFDNFLESNNFLNNKNDLNRLNILYNLFNNIPNQFTMEYNDIIEESVSIWLKYYNKH